ncbi:Inositol-1-monophosphatase [Roseimaritima multifibrata]|uniref:Inositol-1-monophosphatase n=1 Tax=Roseimaritima multifibrata TaxID=1930274 RepID=A0A517M9S0_9BACT|nr:inositol monophosphatase family protein [Roseimaritima multifibrata]QDS91638.1 Inositol-1-monophosphatase [Roseimaritima multifibrata]
MTNERLLEIAKSAALGAGEILLRYRKEGVLIRNKAESGGVSHDLVSDADLHSEQHIAEVLRKETPGYELLGEETLHGAADAEHLWVIDPLDGTNNYAHGLPHFAVSIAYYHAGVAQVGVVYNPVHDDWFTAIAGQGAFYNGQRVHVAESESLGEVLIGCGFYYDRGDMMRKTLAAIGDLFETKIHGIRRFGTASLDLCQVGVGQFGGFFEFQLAPWDFAAGRLFVEEAGGKVTTAIGTELPMAKTSLVASNDRLHDAILAITKKHWQS